MKYKVEAYYIGNEETYQVATEWVTTNTHLDACAIVLLNLPNVQWLDPILVVDENYNIGSYSSDCVKDHADFMVGLRELA
jgi:hypothetical protein